MIIVIEEKKQSNKTVKSSIETENLHVNKKIRKTNNRIVVGSSAGDERPLNETIKVDYR